MTGPFEALGDATRRRILVLLAAGERPAGELVTALRDHLPISQPAVSQHLRTLLDAGLVTVRAEGRRRAYAVDPAGLAGVRTWLAGLEPLTAFEQPLDALATEVARGRRTPQQGPGASRGAHPFGTPPTRRTVEG
ncbi:MAG: metalloregulator ArsR/SmtB family transcription factor [Nocardioides sp.]